jgi:hypothetical protein
MSVIEIMNRVASGELSAQEATALMPGSKAPAKLTLKVSDKGAVSLYGMGRFPVTLYGQQWEKVLGHADEIKAFLKTNSSKLAVKE